MKATIVVQDSVISIERHGSSERVTIRIGPDDSPRACVATLDSTDVQALTALLLVNG